MNGAIEKRAGTRGSNSLRVRRIRAFACEILFFTFFFSLVDVRAGILVQEIKLVRSYWLTITERVKPL